MNSPSEASTQAHPQADVAALDQAWTAIEQAVHQLGELIRKVTVDDPRSRFEGYRSALSLVSDNFIAQLYAKAQQPETLPYIGLVSNYAGPTPDMNYFMVQVEPGQSYRVWGTRGTSKFLDMQQLTGWYGQDSPGNIRTMSNETFESQNIASDADGRFEFVLGPTRPSDTSQQWWKLADGVKVLLFREFFTDYATQQESAVLHFEAITGQAQNREWSQADSVNRLRAFAVSMQQYGFCFGMGHSFATLGNNRFRTESFGGDAGQSDQVYIQARYEVPAGHALIGEWKVPETCSYWSFSLYNDVYETLDYSARQTNLNDALGDVGADGVFRFVVADFDPGVANWLDIDGHPLGLLLLRAKQARGAQDPTVRLVAAVDLERELHPGMKRVDAAQCQRVLDMRRRHYLHRMQR